MSLEPSKLHKVLNGSTLVALVAAGALLGGSFYVEGDIARAFHLGAFCFAFVVLTLLFIIKKVVGALDASRERFQWALAISNDGLWDWDLTTNRVYFSPRWREVLGYRPEEVKNTSEFWKSLIHPDDLPEMLKGMQAHLDGFSELHQMENRLRTKSGGYRWNLTRARVVSRDKAGNPLRIVGVDVDMTKFHQLSEQLSHQEAHDALTGLINRREFERRLRDLLEHVRGKPAEHAVCHIDIDQFKVVNETCGSNAGDQLLCQLTEVIRTRIRQRDTLARIGGDEFGVLMRECSIGHADQIAHQILESVEAYRFHWEGRTFTVSASIGLVPVGNASDSLTSILSAADSACHAAKDAGRARIHVFSKGDTDIAERHGRMQWVSRLGRALDEGRFRLSFQPIQPIQSVAGIDGAEVCRHYELLIRMQDEKGDIIPPGAFLPAAELYNLATKLDRWVLVSALDWMSRHPHHVRELELCSINLSGHSIGQESFLDFVVEQLTTRDFPAEKLCFEITETAAIANLEHANRFIRVLKNLGSRFALDDFGSGLSSFAYLKNLPVDYLKIDGMFVKDLLLDPIHLAMVRSINEIGHVMGMKTVAEFVEDRATLAKLREMGVDYAQGYCISAPRPMEELVPERSGVSYISRRTGHAA